MDQAERQGQLRRRRLMAGVAALVAGALARATAIPAEAGHDGNPVLHIGVNNTAGATATTQLTANARPAFMVFNGSSPFFLSNNTDAIVAGVNESTAHAVYGVNPGGSAVEGVTDSGTGVSGQAIYDGRGVEGSTSSGIGVRGTCGMAVSHPAGRAGVLGRSRFDTGVAGASQSNTGVWGHSTSNFGVYGSSSNSTGVAGNSPNYIGVYGQSNGGVGVWGSASTGYAMYGVSTSGIGIYGASGSYIGVSASSGTSTALFAASNSGLAAYFQGPVQVQGNFTVLPGFAKSVAVTHPDGTTRRMYCMESPESYFEDFGDGQLVNGRTTVTLDTDFAAVVRSDQYRLFLTPKGDCKGLYVSSQSPTSCEVRELQGGTSGVAFSYRVVAKRKDIAGPRMERVDLSTRPEPPARPRIQEPTLPPAPPAERPPEPPRPPQAGERR